MAHYRLLGVDGIHVYDNVSDDGTSELLAALDLSGDLHRVHWPRRDGANPQRAAYEHFLQEAAHRYDWVLFCDVDEFLMVPAGLAELVHGAVRVDPEVSALAIPWLMFGADQQESRRPGLVSERFVNCAAEPGPSVKTMVRPSAALRMRTHICDLVWGHYLDTSYQRPRWDPRMPINLIGARPGHAVLHHYFTKSRQEWVHRRQNPRADRVELSFRHLEMFERYWCLPARDDSARRQKPRLATEVRRLDERIDAQPTARHHLSIEMISITSSAVIGRVVGRGACRGVQVRVVLDGTEEVLAPVALGPEGTVFRAGTRGHDPAVTTVCCSIVGRRTATTFQAHDYANQVKVLSRLMEHLPSAEDLIFSTALRTARSAERLQRMRDLRWPAFDKHPWFTTFWNAVFVLEEDGEAGRAALALLAQSQPKNAAEIGGKLLGERTGYLGELLDHARVDRTTLQPMTHPPDDRRMHPSPRAAGTRAHAA